MYMKKKYGWISIVVCVMLAVSVPLSVSATNKSSVTSDSIKKKEEQISKAEKEKEQLEGNLSDIKGIKKKLENQKADLQTYVVELDETLARIEQNISNLKNQITTKGEEIRLAEQELKAATEREESQQESMRVRIRLMYERSNSNVLEMLLQATGVGDMLSRADYMEKVMAYDKRMWEEYKENRQLIALCKEELELEKQILDQAKEMVETEQNNLEVLIDQKTKDIVAYESDIDNKEKAIKEYEAEIAQQNAEIEALEAAIAEEKKKLLEGSGSLSYDGGLFKFPLASYTRVSDDYGPRIHPILKVEQFHNGVDFAAPKGTAIYAAYDGKVVAATYSSSMGNYVMIDHGDELYTIYMHASALYVEKGDVVVRGETIAAVGSTGRSTGNHLHFSVRKNGEYVSPWNYLSK